jgi:hypothetical protein
VGYLHQQLIGPAPCGCQDAEPIIPPDLRKKPRRPVNSDVRALLMQQNLIVKIIFFEALVAYFYDAYIIVNHMPLTTRATNSLSSGFKPLIEALLVLLLVRMVMYFLLVIQTRKMV